MFSISKKWFISKSFYSKKVAVLIDLKEGKLNSSSLNLFSAAQKLSSNFSVFISTSDPKMELDAKEQLLKVNNFPKGVNEIFVNCDEGTAENITENISSIFVNEKFTHLLTIHDSFGKNCLPRIASKISESVLVTDVLSIENTSEDDSLKFERLIYAGNAIAKVETKAKNHFISIRSTAFPSETIENNSSTIKVTIRNKDESKLTKLSRVINREISKSDRPELGASAKIVVSGGRALKSADNFEKLIYPLADVLGAAVGASRAAVDAGYVSNDLQVGQTGKIVAPQLYIAIGISGAIQHVAGMKDSKVIVAINKDADCPIIQVADYSLIGDLFTILPELTEKLKMNK